MVAEDVAATFAADSDWRNFVAAAVAVARDLKNLDAVVLVVELDQNSAAVAADS